MDAGSRPRASSSGTGSNLNNMLGNFSRNNGSMGNSNAKTINNRSIFINRTHSDNAPTVENISKSVGTSFVMSLRERVSDKPTADPLIIRHAGYLLKRSNFPVAINSNSVIATTHKSPAEDENGASIMEPPMIENVIRQFPLPDLDQLPSQVDLSSKGEVREILDDINTDEIREDDTTKVIDEDTCFCSPVVQYFETLFGKRTPNALIESSSNQAETTSKKTFSKTLSHSLPASPRHTQPLPINSSASSSPSYLRSQSSTLNYNVPLKAPARSIPVPISPQITRPVVQRTGSASLLASRNLSSRNLSRSYSNGSKLNISTMANNINSASNSSTHGKEIKSYPPPPADYIDPKDGHIWRSKYCVLEDGILYFYRNAEEGESDEAQEERNESKYQSMDALEGTGFGYESTTSSPNRPSLGRVTNGNQVASFGISGRTLLRESRESRQNLTDLSKSPMPYKKSDIFEYATNRYGSNLSGSQSSTSLHHSHSTNTFNFDSDILWEKRVALDCVGAVRSSEQEHGDHAFELLAFGMDGRTDEMSDSLSGKSQDEVVDRLILRAGSSDEMNNWMFQFHRSLSSYMQKIVQQHNSHRPDSPLLHYRLPTPVNGGKGLSSNAFGARQSSSPTANSFGGSLAASNLPGSLSHGHGRNALYRRQIRDTKDGTLLISPVSTPGGGSSPVDATKDLGRSQVLTKAENEAMPPIAQKEDAAPKKYIPPHLRNKEGPKKYIPPHLRGKSQHPETNCGETIDAVMASMQQLHEEPLVDVKRDASDLGQDSYSDSATSSLLSRQMDDDSVSVVVNIRLGGCADPTIIDGSILDHHYINRKASVVGNDRLEAYGGRGGGFYEQSLSCVENHQRPNRCVLKWEVGAASECGVRNSNEDAYVAINNLDEMIRSQGLVSFADQDFGETKQQGLYAIFDGHVGNQAARFGAEKFPEILIEEQSSLASRDSATTASIEQRTDIILRSAFNRLDRDFCNLCTKDGRDWDSGSTALVALIVDDVVTLANLGDCRGVVCRMVSSSDKVDLDGWESLDGRWDSASTPESERSRDRLFFKEVTEIHSPLLLDERARIERANGWIVNETEIPTGQLHRMDFFDKDVIEIVKRCFADRLKQHRSDPVRQIQIARTCGDLAVSRAIGDRDFKAAYNIPPPSINNSTTPEEMVELSMSWEGPPVFLYPEGHSKRFKGDLVSHEPDITFFRVGQRGVENEFLLMACDGLWDVMDGDDAVRIAKDLLFDKKLSAKDGAARLAELAKHLGSSDNITVVLIRFYWKNEEA